MTFPGNKRDDPLGALRTLIAYKGDNTADYLRPFYTEWCARKYNKGNTAWLTDWAVSGEIPPARRNGKASEPKGFAGIREYLEEIENEQNNG